MGSLLIVNSLALKFCYVFFCENKHFGLCWESIHKNTNGLCSNKPRDFNFYWYLLLKFLNNFFIIIFYTLFNTPN